MIVDMPPTWQPWTDDVLAGSDRIYVVTEFTVPALRKAHELVSALQERLDKARDQGASSTSSARSCSAAACSGRDAAEMLERASWRASCRRTMRSFAKPSIGASRLSAATKSNRVSRELGRSSVRHRSEVRPRSAMQTGVARSWWKSRCGSHSVVNGNATGRRPGAPMPHRLPVDGAARTGDAAAGKRPAAAARADRRQGHAASQADRRAQSFPHREAVARRSCASRCTSSSRSTCWPSAFRSISASSASSSTR